MTLAPRRLVAGVLHVGPAFSYVAAIFVGGSLSGGETYVSLTDKQIHAAAFGTLVPLLVRALRFARPALSLPRLIAAAAGLSSALGGLLELWQALLPHRDADVFDWVADTLGAGVAAFVLVGLALLFGVIDTTNVRSTRSRWDRSP